MNFFFFSPGIRDCKNYLNLIISVYFELSLALRLLAKMIHGFKIQGMGCPDYCKKILEVYTFWKKSQEGAPFWVLLHSFNKFFENLLGGGGGYVKPLNPPLPLFDFILTCHE
jgi:hypothetical protein